MIFLKMNTITIMTTESGSPRSSPSDSDDDDMGRLMSTINGNDIDTVYQLAKKTNELIDKVLKCMIEIRDISLRQERTMRDTWFVFGFGMATALTIVYLFT
jgi:hypothetical protein